MLRISKTVDYAVRCVLYLSMQPEGAVVRRKEVSLAMDISGELLGRIARQLARSGFIEITKGARGGYRLLHTPEEISLLDVIEAVDGPIFLSDCIMMPETCFKKGQCSVRKVWERAKYRLRTTLSEADFGTLQKEESCLKYSFMDKRK